MTPQEFCYWLQGYFELASANLDQLTGKQIEIIKNHLNLVFEHAIDPSYSDDPATQEQLQKIHDGIEQLKNKPPPRPSGSKPTVFRC